MNTSNTTSWKDRLRQERIGRNWRQQDLADHLGTTVLTVQRWERGSHQPSAYFRVKLCALFDISPEEFGFVPDEPSPSSSEESTPGLVPETAGASREEVPALGRPANVPPLSPGSVPEDLLGAPTALPALSQDRETPVHSGSGRLLHRRRVLLLGLTGLGLGALAASGLWFASHPPAPRQGPSSKSAVPTQVPLSQRRAHLLNSTTSNGVNDLAWSPDGRHLAVASDSNVVALWDIAQEALILSYPTLNAWVNDVSWSKTNWIGAATAELHAGALQLWRFPQTTPTFTLKRAYALRSVSWSPNGAYLAFSGHTPNVEVWDPFMGRQVSQYTHPTLGLLGISRVRWSPSGRWLACAADDGSVHVWEALTGKLRTIYGRHHSRVHDVAWSPDERCIVSGSSDTTSHVWDVASGRTLKVHQGHTQEVEGVDWSPRGTAVASASADQTVRVWDPFTGHVLAIYGWHRSIVETVLWSADATRLAIGTEKEGVEIWQAPR